MRKVILITVVCAFVAAPGLASPYGTVKVKYTGVGPGDNMTIYSSGNPGGITVEAGIYNLNLMEASASIPTNWVPYLTGDVDSFCIDVYQGPPGSHLIYDVNPLDEAPLSPDPMQPMGPTKAGHLAALLDANWKDSLTDVEARNLQLAVWEIVDEQTTDAAGDYVFDVKKNSSTAGNFYIADDTVAGAVNSLLSGLGTASFGSKYVGLSKNTDTTTYQDFVVKVPLPAAALLGFLGLSAAGIKLRKFA